MNMKISFFGLKNIHVILRLKVTCFLTSSWPRVPILPFLLLFFVNLFDLSILVSKFQSLYFVFLILLDILRIVWKNLQLIWNFELIWRIYFYLFYFFIGVPHRSQPMKFHDLLGIILLIFYQVPLFQYFFYYTWIELSITWIDSFTVCSFLK